MTTTASGARAEELAARRLEALGYRILARNHRVRQGEVDIVADDRGVICFVEVRSRAGAAFGAPEETISRAKRRRIVVAAQHWLATRVRGKAPPCRFDVVAIVGGGEIKLIKDAFRLEDC